MRVKLLGAAEKDIEEGHHFYEKQAPGLGVRNRDVVDKLYKLGKPLRQAQLSLKAMPEHIPS